MLQTSHHSAEIPQRFAPGLLRGLGGRKRVAPADDGRDPLAALGTHVQYGARGTIVREGEAADWLFRITDGVVKLHRLLPDGRCQIVGLLFAGDFLGIDREGAVSCSANAVGRVTAERFPRRAVEQLCDSSAVAAGLLLRWASHELLAAQDQILLLGRKTPREKLASFLLGLSRRQRDPAVIRLPMTRTDIADYLGVTLETVSRSMGQLRRDGLIKPLDRKAVRIVDLPALEQVADCT